MIYYRTSSGEMITEATIKKRYSRALADKHGGRTHFVCEGCGEKAHHNDHTIARARCKIIGKAELIYDPDNFVNSCAECHANWENFKTGKYLDANNVTERMMFLKMNDPEGYNIRITLTES